MRTQYYICQNEDTKRLYKSQVKMTKTPSKKPTNDELRLRVIEAKKALGGEDKRINYTQLYEYTFGPQNTKLLNKIRAVWNLREVDEEITKQLEEIAESFKQSTQKSGL